MLYYLGQELSSDISILNLFRYITFRTGAALITSALIVFLFGPSIIAALKIRQGKGQPIRADGPESHFVKAGTPTMGGLMILSGVLVSSLLWSNLSSVYVWVVLMVTIGFGAIGFYDDYLKVTKQSDKGFSGKVRLTLEFLIAGIACAAIATNGDAPFSTSLTFPFFKDLLLNLGWFFIPFGAFVIVAAGNAVNLTDGLDGLAILPCVLISCALAVFAYASGHIEFANYLHIPYLPGTGELVVFCAAMVGSGLGFLWFNSYPAQVFMGDVGALSLGAALGIIAVIVRHEIIFFVMSGIFVMETASVILQVASFKLTGRRIFRMAPLHHHFELKGWPEPRVIVRFWIITVMLVLFGLATLKLR